MHTIYGKKLTLAEHNITFVLWKDVLCLVLAVYLNFSTSSSDKNFVEIVVVAPRTQRLLSGCPACIVIQLMNIVFRSAVGYVLLSFAAWQNEGENCIPGLQVFHCIPEMC